jgi:hypothetical protein
MTVAAYVALAVLVAATAALVALRPWPFPPSLTVSELNGFVRLNASDPGRGAEALSGFYGWRQDLWSMLARGCGGARPEAPVAGDRRRDRIAYRRLSILARCGLVYDSGATPTTPGASTE